MDIAPTPAVLLIPFLSTFALYTLNRYTDREDRLNHPQRHRFTEKHKTAMICLAVSAYSLALVLGLLAGLAALFTVVLPFVSVVFYSLPSSVLGRLKTGDRRQKTRLKDILLIKNLTISATVALSAAVLPLSAGNARIEAALFVFGFFLGRIFINTVVFDVRDVRGDEKEGVRTVPVVVGCERARGMLVWVNWAIALMVAVYGAWVLMFSCLYAQWYLRRAKGSKDLRFLCDVVVDGEYIIVAVLL